MNPSPCGFHGDSQKPCTCAPATVVTKYQKRVSGPLLDCINIRIEIPKVDYEKLSGHKLGEASAPIRKCVKTTKDVQDQRFGLYCRHGYRVK